MSKSKNHHYVPQHLVRNFSTNKKGQVHVFDKQTDSAFLTSTKNILSETKFHEFRHGDYTISYEGKISKIENIYYETLAKVIREQSVKSLKPNEVAELAIFTSFQFIRTKAFRDKFNEMSESMLERIGGIGMIAAGSPAQEQLRKLTDDELKIQSYKFIQESTGTFAGYLTEKNFFLVKAPEYNKFILGDAPVVLSNSKNFGPHGNIGFQVPGIEVYVPITPRLALAYWCPSLLKEMEEACLNLSKTLVWTAMNKVPNERLEEITGETREETLERVDILRKAILEITDDKLLNYTDENVTYQNCLQVQYASRFLLSDTNNFDLALRMIADDPNYRGALKVMVN